MSQEDRVRAYLVEHPEGIDPFTATDRLGVYRLSSAIKRLRDDGLHIATFKNGNLAHYRLIPQGVDEAAWAREQGEPCYFGVDMHGQEENPDGDREGEVER
jgi:hypothetical protein